MLKTTEKDNVKGESDRPNSPTHQAITRQASEGEISIHFMSRYDVLTDYHPFNIELVQENKLMTHCRMVPLVTSLSLILYNLWTETEIKHLTVSQVCF